MTLDERTGRIDLTPQLFSDSIEFMAVYIAYMRSSGDTATIPGMLQRFNSRIFTNPAISTDQLRQLAVYAADKLYRFATKLEVRDAYTVVYCKTVIAQLLASLRDSGTSIMYILDNELRQDRFELAVLLFELSGAAVVTPYAHGGAVSCDAVEDRIKSLSADGRHIVYIEKDASVNYIGQVIRTPTRSKYIRVFRNQAPDSNHVEVL